jgi:homoserine O-acetyltransferase
MSWITLLLLLSAPARAQAPAVGDYTQLAVQDDYVVRDFKFHTGEKLPQLRLHYAAWGTHPAQPRRRNHKRRAAVAWNFG